MTITLSKDTHREPRSKLSAVKHTHFPRSVTHETAAAPPPHTSAHIVCIHSECAVRSAEANIRAHYPHTTLMRMQRSEKPLYFIITLNNLRHLFKCFHHTRWRDKTDIKPRRTWKHTCACVCNSRIDIYTHTHTYARFYAGAQTHADTTPQDATALNRICRAKTTCPVADAHAR